MTHSEDIHLCVLCAHTQVERLGDAKVEIRASHAAGTLRGPGGGRAQNKNDKDEIKTFLISGVLAHPESRVVRNARVANVEA